MQGDQRGDGYWDGCGGEDGDARMGLGRRKRRRKTAVRRALSTRADLVGRQDSAHKPSPTYTVHIIVCPFLLPLVPPCGGKSDGVGYNHYCF